MKMMAKTTAMHLGRSNAGVDQTAGVVANASTATTAIISGRGAGRSAHGAAPEITPLTYTHPAAKCSTLMVLRPDIYDRHSYRLSSFHLEANARADTAADGGEDHRDEPPKKRHTHRMRNHIGKCLHCNQTAHEWESCWQVCAWCGTRDHNMSNLQPAAECSVTLAEQPNAYMRQSYASIRSQIKAEVRAELREQVRHETEGDLMAQRAGPPPPAARTIRNFGHDSNGNGFSFRGAATRERDQQRSEAGYGTGSSTLGSAQLHRSSLGSGHDSRRYTECQSPRPSN